MSIYFLRRLAFSASLPLAMVLGGAAGCSNTPLQRHSVKVSLPQASSDGLAQGFRLDDGTPLGGVLPLHLGLHVTHGTEQMRLGLDKVTPETAMDLSYGDITVRADLIAMGLPVGTSAEQYCAARGNQGSSGSTDGTTGSSGGGGGGPESILYARVEFQTKIDRGSDILNIALPRFTQQKMRALGVKFLQPNGQPAAFTRITYLGPTSQLPLRDPCDGREISDTADEKGILTTDFPLDILKNNEFLIHVTPESLRSRNLLLRLNPTGGLAQNLFSVTLPPESSEAGLPQGPVAPLTWQPDSPQADFDGNGVSNEAQWQAGLHPAKQISLSDSQINVQGSFDSSGQQRVFLNLPWDLMRDAEAHCTIVERSGTALTPCGGDLGTLAAGNWTLQLRLKDRRSELWLSPVISKSFTLSATNTMGGTSAGGGSTSNVTAVTCNGHQFVGRLNESFQLDCNPKSNVTFQVQNTSGSACTLYGLGNGFNPSLPFASNFLGTASNHTCSFDLVPSSGGTQLPPQRITLSAYALPLFNPSGSPQLFAPDLIQRNQCVIQQGGTVSSTGAFGTNMSAAASAGWGIYNADWGLVPSAVPNGSILDLKGSFTAQTLEPQSPQIKVTGSDFIPTTSQKSLGVGYFGPVTVTPQGSAVTPVTLNGVLHQTQTPMGLQRHPVTRARLLDELNTATGFSFSNPIRMASRVPQPGRQVAMQSQSNSNGGCLLCTSSAEDWGLMAAGPDSTCQVGHDGKLRCWGHNAFGQFGSGNTTGSGFAVETYANQAATSLLAQLTAGGYFGSGTPSAPASAHTCGLFYTDSTYQNTTLKCWGSNNQGQLGMGSVGTTQLSPQVVTGMENAKIISVSAGSEHTCAVKIETEAGVETGKVYCWGDNRVLGTDFPNGVGRVGSPTELQYPNPILVPNVSGALQVVAGHEHSCALQWPNGDVKCWGSYQNATVLGASVGVSGSPVVVLGLTGVAQLAAGSHHTCALMASGGGVKCWGRNTKYQLGNGLVTDSQVPVDVLVAGTSTPLMNVVQIASSGAYTCAIQSTGDLYCWGEQNYNSGTNEGRTSKATSVTNLLGATGVAVGPRHVCVTTRPASDDPNITGGNFKHRTFCWGNNTLGAAGVSTSSTLQSISYSPLFSDGGAVSSQPTTSTPLLPRQRQCQSYLLVP